MRIAIVAPSCSLKREAAERVAAIAAARGDCDLIILRMLPSRRHSPDRRPRSAALVEVLADSAIDAVWLRRGLGRTGSPVALRASCSASRPNPSGL